MSDSKYRPRRRMNKENSWARRDENRRRRRRNNSRIRLGLETLRFRGTQGWLTW